MIVDDESATVPAPADGDAADGCLDEPLLLIAYNRPATFRAQLEALRRIAPRRVFAAFDGPRDAADARLTAQTRSLLDLIDWDCSVEVRASDANLGCRRGVVAAIDWFFDTVERGVILEDDIIPTRQFLEFERTMLDRYQDDPRIASVIGINRVPARFQSGAGGYRFTRYAHVWGWGTWRRVWRLYRADITGWRSTLPERELVRRVDSSWLEALEWRQVFDAVADERLDTWDAQLEYLVLSRGLLCVSPRRSLVTNIGFGADATHTTRDQPHLETPDPDAVLDLAEVPVVRDSAADRWEARHVRRATLLGLAGRVARRVLPD